MKKPVSITEIQGIITKALELNATDKPVDLKNVLGHVYEKLEELKKTVELTIK